MLSTQLPIYLEITIVKRNDFSDINPNSLNRQSKFIAYTDIQVTRLIFVPDASGFFSTLSSHSVVALSRSLLFLAISMTIVHLFPVASSYDCIVSTYREILNLTILNFNCCIYFPMNRFKYFDSYWYFFYFNIFCYFWYKLCACLNNFNNVIFLYLIFANKGIPKTLRGTSFLHKNFSLNKPDERQ